MWTRFHPKVLWCQVVKLVPQTFMGISNPGVGIIGARKENLKLHFGLVPIHFNFMNESTQRNCLVEERVENVFF